MKKKIYVKEDVKAHLRRLFGCSNVMIWKALAFESESELAKKIRYVALKDFGGVPNWKPSEMETTHEETADTMTQFFGTRVKLVVNKRDASVVVYMDDQEIRREQCGSIPEFIALQDDVKCLTASL